jgi:CRISPR-associated endoribonuclease Cas6
MELFSLVLPLKPVPQPTEPATAPLWWGRAGHALLLDVIRKRDETLAATLHEVANPKPEAGNQTRPFTASTLMGRFNKGALIPDQTYILRLTAFRADVANALEAESTFGSLRGGQLVELDYHQFQIQNPQSQTENPQSPWSAASTYQDLSAPFLLSKENAPRRVTLQLTSPTTFKSGGRHVPVPTPSLVFGSLLERWNAFAPIAFPAEVKRYAEECLAISKYELKTKPIPQKGEGLRVGAVGSVTFTAVNYDRYWMSVITTLAEFALYCGLGTGTAQGLGQARRSLDF